MGRMGVLEGSLRAASLSRDVARSAASLAPEGGEVVILPSTESLPHRGGARVYGNLRQPLHRQDMKSMAEPEIQIGGAGGKLDVEAGAITYPDTADFLRKPLDAFDSVRNSWTGRPCQG